MTRRILWIAAILIATILLAAAAFFSMREITVNGSSTWATRGPYLRVGQALEAAGFPLREGDQVSPGLTDWIPLDGKITVMQAAHVWIWDSGWMQQVHSPDTVLRQVLRQAAVALDAQDRVFWNGQPVPLDMVLPVDRPVVLQIQRAKVVRLQVGEAAQEVITRGPAVSHALWQAGIRPGPGDRVSVPYGTAVTMGLSVGYLPARAMQVQAGDQQVSFASAAQTVAEALASAGVRPQAYDIVVPAEDQAVPEDGIIHLVRVREEVLLTETLTPYESSFAPDPDLDLDARRVLQPGQYGVQVTRERVRYENGQEVSRAVDSDWTASQAVAETVGYGTKVVVQTADMPDGTIEYWRKVHVYATSYSPCRLGTADNRCGYITASGARLTKGIVAVPRAWFGQMNGQRVYIPGYGFGVIADTGGMRGLHIDLGFDEDNFEAGAIVGWVDLYFLTPIPAAIPWTLP